MNEITMISSFNGVGKWHRTPGCGCGNGSIYMNLDKWLKDQRFNHYKLCKNCFSEEERNKIFEAIELERKNGNMIG